MNYRTQQDEWVAVADRFWDALDQGNVEEAVACYAPSSTTWHNFDQKSMDVAESETALRAFVDRFCERSTTQVGRDFFEDGFVQRHVLIVRMKPNSPRRAWAVCALMRFRDGKIASIAEYIDRAGSFSPDDKSDQGAAPARALPTLST
jgi:ketosteroid isomerase-like protein